MAKSILECGSSGDRICEPMYATNCGSTSDLMAEFAATDAEPGSAEKLAILACRIQQGLPLWHPLDRRAEDILMAEIRRAASSPGG